MSDKRGRDFDEFWAEYLHDHSNSHNRALHVIGTLSAIVVAVFAVAVRMPVLLLLMPVVGYGPAWVGHFFVEHNRPTAMRQPLWSLRADFKMTWLSLTGQLQTEMRRVQSLTLLACTMIVPLAEMLSDVC